MVRVFDGVVANPDGGRDRSLFVAGLRPVDYVARSPKRLVLIDGRELARLMVRYGIGVRTRDRYEIKKIDEDYFDQDAV